MSWKYNRLGVAAVALLGLAASSCSCGEAGSLALAPKLELTGDAVATDSTVTAHHAIDFGMVTVGSKSIPEVFIGNTGTARLNVQVEDFDQIQSPFSLNFRTLDLQTNERRQVEFSVAPREVGPFETTITLKTNEKDGIRKIRLHGVAIQSQLDCTPSDVHIGEVVKGESRTTTVSCTNHLPIPTTIVLGNFIGAYQKYFSAELQAGDGRSVEIAPDESVNIQLGFHADSNITGAASVSLPITDPSKQTMETLTVSATAIEHALQVRYEENGNRIPLVGCYKFPDTDLGMAEERTLYVRNLSNNPIHIENLSLLHENAHFSIVSPSVDSPILVKPNGEEEVEVVVGFHPGSAANHSNRLIIRSDDFLEPEGGVGACIEGQGGGARIACLPSQIDFGPVAIGMSVSREYTCTNNAQIREGSIPQVLYVNRVLTDNPSKFSAELVDHKTNGYAVGEEFKVKVTYAPSEETLDVALIIVDSNASATPLHETRVSGQGRDLPNCDYTLSPSTLRFGVVAPGSQRTLTAYVENLRETECIISNLRLSEDTHESFSMEPVESVVLPGRDANPELVQRYPITVTFAPSNYGSSFTGSADFYISNIDAPEQSVGLTGISQPPCIEFDPVEIDFGAAPPTCAGREVFVSVANTCTSTLSIDDISIDGEAYPQFVIHTSPIFPYQLKGGDRLEFSVYFQPDTEGEHRGAIVAEVFDLQDGSSEPLDIGPYLLEMKGTGTYDAVQTDTYVQKDTPKVDVLWVIDNSGSMSSSQALIQSKVPNFMQFAVEQGIDFHVGITTSGVASRPSSACTAKTGFPNNEDGRLVPHPSLNRPRILKSSMAREYLFEHFRNNIDVGICHAYEAMYEAARVALSDPHINNPIDDPTTAGNQGFLRRDASLSIILVTDEDDVDSWWEGVQSNVRTPERYVEFFQGLKPSRKKDSVKVHAISGGLTGCSTPWAMACPRCLRGPELTGGVWLDICTPPNDPAWDDGFREMSQGAFGFDSAFGLRGVPADNNGDHLVDDRDMEVRVAGRIRPSVSTTGARIWRYNPDNNSVSFSPLYVPGPSQEIDVTYKVACMSYND